MKRILPERVTLIDKIGPFKGQERTYARHAAEHALDMGFAEFPPKEIPAEFPGRDALLAFGIASLDDVPSELDVLVAIPKIGKKTAKEIVAALADIAE